MISKIAQINKILKKLQNKNPNIDIGFANVREVVYISTPFSTLDTLNNGGIPRGKFGTIAGSSQTAKSTLLAQIIAHAQQEDQEFITLWTDAEESVDTVWMESLGVDMSRVMVQKYDKDRPYMESLLDDALQIVSTQSIDMWVIDSIGALQPKADEEKLIEENKMLNLQRKLGEFFRKAIKNIASTNDWPGCACVMIGQVYNVPTTTGVGLEEVRGGNSVKHWAHFRWKTRRGNRLEGPEPVEVQMPDGQLKKLVPGWAQHIKLDKSKLNDREGQEIILQFVNGRGLDSVNSAITALLANNIIVRNGAMYYHALFQGLEEANAEGKVRGRDSVISLLSSNKELRNQLIEEMDNILQVKQLESKEPITKIENQNES